MIKWEEEISECMISGKDGQSVGQPVQEDVVGYGALHRTSAGAGDGWQGEIWERGKKNKFARFNL